MKPFLRSLLILSALAANSYASPSGLNNIPTADTTPQGTFALQAYSTIGGLADGDFNLGLKTGVDFKYVKLELGVDDRVYSVNQGGPVTVQGKIALPLGEHLPTLAIGAAGVTFRDEDRRRAGDEFFYAVATQEVFGLFRLHGGAGLQDGEVLPFAGLDKTFHYQKQVPAASDGKSVADGKSIRGGQGGKSVMPSMETKTIDLFTLRGDVIAQRDSSWLYSVGVLVPLGKYFVFETWANLPDNGDSPSWTIKGNFVISF